MGEEELQLQIALALSREEAQKEEDQRKSDDVRLQMALNESKTSDVSSTSIGAATASAGASQRNHTVFKFGNFVHKIGRFLKNSEQI